MDGDDYDTIFFKIPLKELTDVKTNSEEFITTSIYRYDERLTPEFLKKYEKYIIAKRKFNK